MEKEYKMSAARAQELQEELNYLKTTRSDEVAEQIKTLPAYKIVGSQEADPMHGIISEESPFGKALLGAKEGDTVTVEAPRGAITYTVQKIER